MINSEHVRILKQGAEAWNNWRHDENDEIKPDLIELDLSDADLSGMDLSTADLSKANLSGANLIEVDLSGANLYEANLSRAILREADLSGADLIEANFSEADLSWANLIEADLSDANFSGADLNRANLREAYLSGANLSGAKLFRANLREANLIGANLIRADLCEAILQRANLTQADLSGADLSKVDLSEAELVRADLSNSDLNEANLNNSDLTQANLTKAGLTRVSLVETILEDANLTGCRVYGISAWDIVVNQGTKQSGLIITNPEKATVTVDDLEVAQFIYFMLENKKIRRVINALTSKAVLILGRFSKNRKEILDALKDKLSRMDYLPIIFDFEKPTDRDFTETVLTLACLSKFVIVDLTDPSSTPHESKTAIPELEIPFIPIIQEGHREYAMFGNFEKYRWVLEGKTYKNKADLILNIEKLTEAAEAKYLEIKNRKGNSSSRFTPISG